MSLKRSSSMIAAVLVGALAAGCAPTYPAVRLTEDWPTAPRPYREVVDDWTRRAQLDGDYQQICELVATLKAPEWRAARAVEDADARGLAGDARTQQLAQAQADAASAPYEVEVLFTTWDRRENDLDRGKKSVWRVALIDERGQEIAPLEIVKDRRPTFVVRAEYPAFGEFATPYVVRFARTAAVLGPSSRQVRLRVSSARGGVEVRWAAP